MAKKTNKQQIQTGNTIVDRPEVSLNEQPAPQQKQQSKIKLLSLFDGNSPLSFSAHALVATCIAVITWLFLKVCLNNQFTNWDDAGYIVQNPIVKDISQAGLKAIFTEPVMGNYHPLTILSYAIEYSLVELEPWLYHFDSLALHILVTLLVYWFVNLLTHRPVAAIVTALLFGLHPMHIESVAWVAGRKDLFCCLFFIAACVAYVGYIRKQGNKKWIWYSAVILLFICSLLSKPVAVTLPVTLLLIDYFEKRPWKNIILAEKIPHFILALIFGIISVKIQHGGGAMSAQKVSYNALERIILGSYALITYLWKAIVPVNLCCFYPYPQKINGSLPFINYVYPLAAATLLFILWKYARKNRVIVFGSLFFLVNIALLLQFIPVGEAILAERYTYIPYFGLFFIAGWLVSLCFEQGMNKELKHAVLILFLVYTSVLGFLSNERCNVWYDSISLWTDEIEKEPTRAPLAYNNLGFIYFDKWSAATDPGTKNVYYDSAFYFMQKTIEIKPDFVNSYQGLGMLYYSKGNFVSSAFCFRTAMQLQPTAEAHSDYGNLLNMTGKGDSAIMEYGIALSLNPALFVAYLNRGKVYKEQNRWDDARKDFDAAIKINPAMGEIYYDRSFCDTQQGNTMLAVQDIEKAVSLGFRQIDTGYYQGLKK